MEVSAQNGSLELDESFAPQFWGALDFQAFVLSGLCDESGGIYIAGDFSGNLGDQMDDCLLKLDEMGSVDNYFQKDLSIPYGLGAYGLTSQDIFIYCITSGGILKFDTSGDCDQGFNDSLHADVCVFEVNNLILFDDGKITAAGVFSDNLLPFPFDSCAYEPFFLGRFNSNGTLDSNFVASLGAGFDKSTNIVKSSDEQIICYGNFSYFNDYYTPRICKLNQDGTLDTSFQSIFSNELSDPVTSELYIITSLFEDQHKRLIVSGHMLINGDTHAYPLLRLNSDGSFDSTFNFQNNVGVLSNSADIFGRVYSSLELEDGGYLLGGNFNYYQSFVRNNLVKTDSNGFIDMQYLNDTGPDTAYVEVWNNHFAVRLPPSIYSLNKDSQGRLYVGGHFHKFNNTVRNGIVRLLGLSVGVSPKPENNGMKIFPNPASNTIKATLASQQVFDNITLLITDLAGRVILENKFNKEISLEVNISNLPAQSCLVYVKRFNQTIAFSKLVIVH